MRREREGRSTSGRQRASRLVAMAILAAAGIGTVAHAEGDAARAPERSYRVHYLAPPELDALAREFCSEEPAGAPCAFSLLSGGIRMTADVGAQRRFESFLQTMDVPPPTQVFKIYLYVADNLAAAPEPAPPDLEPVLRDVRGFLPFKSLRQISAGYLRTSEEGRVDLGGDPHHEVEIHFKGDPRSGKPIQIDRFSLVRRHWVKAENGADSFAGVTVISTSFSMNVGETVVVGTSKLDGGDKALVVLLTAVK